MVLRVAAAVLALVVGLLAWPAIQHLREEPPPPTPSIRVSLSAPPGAELGAGDESLDAAISPDGRQVVFVATTGGIARLWRRTFDSDRAEPMSGTDGAQLPAWKHTGNLVSFFAGERLKQISAWNDGNTICGMGDAAGYATLGILDKFGDEFEHFIAHKRSRYDGNLECRAST